MKFEYGSINFETLQVLLQLHQLHGPIPITATLPDFHYLPSTKTPTSGRKPDDFQPRAQMKQMFQVGKPKAGNKKAIKDFSEKVVVSEKLVADYIEHLTDSDRWEREGGEGTYWQ